MLSDGVTLFILYIRDWIIGKIKTIKQNNNNTIPKVNYNSEEPVIKHAEIFENLSRILTLLIIVITVIAFIVSIVVFAKDGNYSKVLEFIKGGSEIESNSKNDDTLVKIFTLQAFNIYYNNTLKISINTLIIVAYLFACLACLDEDDLSFRIYFLIFDVCLYYIIAPVMLWLVTNILGIIGLIILIIFMCIVTKFSLLAIFEGLGEILAEEARKTELIETVKRMNK